MFDTLETKIEALAKKSDNSNSGDALKYSQAALNLAHVFATVAAIRNENNNHFPGKK